MHTEHALRGRACPQRGYQSLGQHKGREKIGGKDALMSFRGQGPPGFEHPGIVDQNRYPGMAGRDEDGYVPRGGQQGEIGDNKLRTGVRRLVRDQHLRGFAPHPVTPDQNHMVTGARQPERDPAPDAAGGTCYDSDGAFDFHRDPFLSPETPTD